MLKRGICVGIMNNTITMKEIIKGMRKIILEGFDEEILESQEMKAIL